MSKCTIFQNIYATKPYTIDLDEALERIRTGVSKTRIEQIRATLDKDKARSLKKMLPSVRFSGIFQSQTDDSLVKHSGFMVLDFDGVYDIGEKMAEITSKDYIYAAWVSPSGTGIKALVKIADGARHRDHFEALKEEWLVYDEQGQVVMRKGKPLSQLDPSGINVSRICYESYDPHIYINREAAVWTKVKVVEQIEMKAVIEDEQKVFTNLLKWLTNRGDAFVTGERNHFLFKLAAACCRFGLDEEVAVKLIVDEFKTPGSDCTMKGFTQPIRNGYKANRHRFGTARFEKDILVDKETRKEVDVQQEFEEVDGKLVDVIYGIDMKDAAIKLFRYGYENIKGIGVPEIDTRWKPWRKEISLLTGHGNYGKSAFEKWYLVFRAVLYGEKVAVFAPEDKEDVYYHELTEILLGQDCTAHNTKRTVTEDEYSNAYDFISAHFFYVYPATLSPTPEYIKEKFLELIIKEGVSWCVIDPFNQLTNDYSKMGGRDDKYLETVLADFKRFAKANNIFFLIIAHPKQAVKDSTGNYPCPDVYDLAGGAMWNNKMDNILVYHRPFAQTAPDAPDCEFHSKKIKDQRVVGEKGWSHFIMHRPSRRYTFNGYDPLGALIQNRKLNWKTPLPIQARLVA